MSNFKAFANVIDNRFSVMSNKELYTVNVTGDEVWQAYLAAFPEGTNPIYRTRTKHDGSYDKAFIRKVGNVVFIDNKGELQTLWNVATEYPYDVVTAKLDALVKSSLINSVFRHDERMVGHLSNIEQLADGSTKKWDHFNTKVKDKHYTEDVAAVLGKINSKRDVFKRGLTELTKTSLAMISDLIGANNLYRGTEFAAITSAFVQAHDQYNKLKTEQQKSVFVWAHVNEYFAEFRNVVIGTLAVDLSKGVPLEDAVRLFESKVAPTNYKRTTALVTPKMIQSAIDTIKSLDLEYALERRFANISDVSVNNVLWVNNSTAPLMKGGALSQLLASATKPVNQGKTTTKIGIDDFMDLVGTAKSIEVMFSNSHENNLVSLTAPVHADVKPIFKWANNFGWSYNGNITDSAIKDRVKAAGGNTNAPLRVSLSWFNYDDLDIHCECPDGYINFRNKARILDVDMNPGGRRDSKTPVENLAWTNPRDGLYSIIVHQYLRMETCDPGFVIEVENNGSISQYSYKKPVTGMVPAITFKVKNGKIVELNMGADVGGQGMSKQNWGLATETFVPVQTILNSPNYWDGSSMTGNKHIFFILQGCLNDEPTRGIYNEFLRSDLEEHRKVFEVLGNKTKCPVVPEQLSGLGFSSTKKDVATFRVVTDTQTRLYEVQF